MQNYQMLRRGEGIEKELQMKRDGSSLTITLFSQ